MKCYALFLLLFLSFTCHAQLYSKHEFQIGYGPWARERILNDAFRFAFRTFSGNQIKNMDFSNSYSMSYRYQPRHKVSLGAALVMANGVAYRSYLFESRSRYEHTSFILAFEAKFTYIDKSLLSLYSIVGLGGVFVNEKDLGKPYVEPRTFARPSGQLTPFGIRYGKDMGAYAEIGWGYKGILNVGISAKF